MGGCSGRFAKRLEWVDAREDQRGQSHGRVNKVRQIDDAGLADPWKVTDQKKCQAVN